MQEQEPPRKSKCPLCDGEPTDESLTDHSLSALGYLHDDAELVCSECGNHWTVGRPIGEFEGGQDLWCSSCDDAWMRVHRIREVENNPDGKLRLHLKCPNCYQFKSVARTPDEEGIALVGYPDITGSIDESAENYGYPPGDPPGMNE